MTADTRDGLSRLPRRISAEVRPYWRTTAALAVAAAVWAVWVSGPSGATPALLVAAVSGAALGVVDARTWRLPDVLVYPTLASVGILLTAAAALTATWGDFGRAGLGALALAVAYLVLHIVDAEPWAR